MIICGPQASAISRKPPDMFAAISHFATPGAEPQLEELYNLRSVYGQRKHALEFCNSTFTTIGEKKFCILHLLEDVKFHTM